MGKASRRAQQRRERDVQQRQNDYEAQLEHEQHRPQFGPLVAQTPKQARLIRLLQERRLVFATGCPGSGKSFIPTSYAVEQLLEGKIERIIVTRPAVGCDEDLGALPGSEMEKFGGWVEPIMDVLHGKMGRKRVETFMKYDKIVIRPLMRMRGITFRNAFVILDEAQNTTPGQMKMFLTRVGVGTHMVINGDLEQSDLPAHKGNGLKDILDRVSMGRNMGWVEFNEDDIVRDS